MVVVTNSGKGQQFLSIGNRDCTNIQLLIQHLCHFHAVHFVKPLAQNAFRRGRHFQRSGRKSRSVFFKHRAFIEQYTHKQCRADGIGDHHWRSNITHQTHRIFIRSGDRQDNQHLHHFSDERDGTGGNGVKDFISAPATDQDAVYHATEQSFNDGRDHAT